MPAKVTNEELMVTLEDMQVRLQLLETLVRELLARVGSPPDVMTRVVETLWHNSAAINQEVML
jgi:hypothetical protein